MISFAVATLLVAAAPRVAVVVHPTGFSDDDAHRVQDKVAAEVTSTGVELWALSKSLEVKSECLMDRQCAREVLRAADAAYLVWVEATRAGGQVQLETHLLDGEGKSVAQDESATRADEVTGAGVLLPASVSATLKVAASPSKPTATNTTTTTTKPTGSNTTTTTTKPTGSNATTTNANTTTTTTTTKASDASNTNTNTNTNTNANKDDSPDAISPMAIGGMTAIGAGALMTIGGGAVALTEYFQVIQNPAAQGTAKVEANNTAVTMFALAGAGVVVAAGGGVLLYLGL